eukprot:759392-Hanusia_phi.AAC.2
MVNRPGTVPLRPSCLKAQKKTTPPQRHLPGSPRHVVTESSEACTNPGKRLGGRTRAGGPRLRLGSDPRPRLGGRLLGCQDSQTAAAAAASMANRDDGGRAGRPPAVPTVPSAFRAEAPGGSD